MLADMLAKEFKIGYDGDDGLYENLSKLYSRLDVSETEYERLKEFASRERENVEGFFKFSS